MKKITLTIVMCFLIIIGSTQKSQAIVWVVVNAVLKKAAMAMDLAVQKKQNKVIWLQNIQKAAENIMAKAKLDDIAGWAKKQKEQYGKYYEELRKVKTIIAYYQRVKQIIARQGLLFREYQQAWQLIKNDKNFTAEEIEYMGRVYSGILDESIKNIEEVTMLVSSFSTQMTDAKRIELINAAANQIELNYIHLNRFTRSNAELSLRRATDEQEILRIKQLYGLNQ